MGGGAEVETIRVDPNKIPFYSLMNWILGARPPDIGPLAEAYSRGLTSPPPVQPFELERLRNAILNAIGTLAYNPYEAFYMARRTAPLPTGGSVEEIRKQLTEFAKEAGPLFRAAGAYVIVPSFPKVFGIPTRREQYRLKEFPFEVPRGVKPLPVEKYPGLDLVDLYGDFMWQARQAAASAAEFFSTTIQQLKDLGLSSEEIAEALAPFRNMMLEGMYQSYMQAKKLGLPAIINVDPDILAEWGFDVSKLAQYADLYYSPLRTLGFKKSDEAKSVFPEARTSLEEDITPPHRTRGWRGGSDESKSIPLERRTPPEEDEGRPERGRGWRRGGELDIFISGWPRLREEEE